MFCFHF